MDERRGERTPEEPQIPAAEPAPADATADADASLRAEPSPDPAPAPPTPVVAPPATAPVRPPARGRGRRPTIGVGLALVLAFAWGALAYRELSPVRQFASAPIAVAGVQAPPGWISDFAKAFCNADAVHLATRMGPPLAGQTEAIAQALATREWSCSTTRFLGGGTNSKGSFYVWLTIDDDQDEQWWVFTVVNDKVIAIE